MSDLIERNNLIDSLNFESIYTPNIQDINTEDELNLWTHAQFTHDNIKPALYHETANKSLSYAPIYPKLSSPSLFPKLTLDELSNVLSQPQITPNDSFKPGNKEKQTTDDDKRKRNTAASARFRVKKKLKEQDKEKTVREMTEKSKVLENRVCSLEQEIKWLRRLLIEKDAVNN